MIHFVTTRSHSYTVESLIEQHGRRQCRQWAYEQIYRLGTLPSGTWVFTDHERLSESEQRWSARIATMLEAGGARVINHPALVRTRFEILRRLKESGINSFSAMRCDSNPRPDRFPVFVRNAYDHKSKNIVLIHSQVDLDAELQKMENRGVPLSGKLVIEYAGEELLPDVWHRLSSFRVAGRIIAHHMAFDRTWIVKDGFNREALGMHPEKERFLGMEREFIASNLYADVIEKAFDLARIEYGRADFSIVGGKVQVYEINTNPNHAFASQISPETHPRRRAIQMQSEGELQQAIVALDRDTNGRIYLDLSMLKRLKRIYRTGYGGEGRP